MSMPLRMARSGVERVEALFDLAFTPAWNPLYHLGALGWFFYWIVAVSGVYLYAFFDTGIQDAYESLQHITHVQWYAGGVMRSLHRYASDALVIVVMLHLFRELVTDRLRGVRWFSWITGVPLLWFVYACGISGYWLVWDKLAQYVAVKTTEWLDTLPFFGEPIARNFLNEATLSGRFFTLMVFIHIAAPLIMLVLMWIHIQRISHAAVNPPKGLAIGTLAALLVLSFAYPAVSHGPANLDVVPAEVHLDWFYLLAYPMLDRVDGLYLWAFFIGGTAVLFCLPWLPWKRRAPVAVVDLANCNGCERCYADCPYHAIQMAPRSDGLAYEREAVVLADKCASCGICAGACPTATPFRSTDQLVPGIDLPDLTVRTLRERTQAAGAALEGEDRIIVYGCAHGPDLDAVAGEGIGVVRVECIAQLPPAFLDYVMARRLADGVLLTGCREGDCYHRLGIRWTRERIAGERDPYLRKRVPRERIAAAWVGLGPASSLQGEIDAFRERIRDMGPLRARPRRDTRAAHAGEAATHG